MVRDSGWGSERNISVLILPSRYLEMQSSKGLAEHGWIDDVMLGPFQQ